MYLQKIIKSSFTIFAFAFIGVAYATSFPATYSIFNNSSQDINVKYISDSSHSIPKAYELSPKSGGKGHFDVHYDASATKVHKIHPGIDIYNESDGTPICSLGFEVAIKNKLFDSGVEIYKQNNSNRKNCVLKGEGTNSVSIDVY